ncbi:MAG TPA: selenocysteine-specific translation elongation factor [Gemmatimonadaceae bacterium]
MIIGTAGHIDHGKTALVKALTGVDTDRLPEEKRRGITIDLGFAPLSLDGVGTVGVVDVPGHEDFVRSMLVGASGIDLGLLVVAADEGVMPQTREHLLILRLLQIPRIVVALTKCDLVDNEWIALARSDVLALFDSGSREELKLVNCSSRTGLGLDELRRVLRESLFEGKARASDDLFRMPVDRAFTVKGTGTVVTGTVWSGALPADASVFVLPSGKEARVRKIEQHGRSADNALAGGRAAVALAGLDVPEVPRGSVLVRDRHWRPTSLIEAVIALDATAAASLTPRTRVRVHAGASEVGGRIVSLAALGGASSPALARITTDSPLVVRGGDRFVLRLPAPMRTIGGGVVIDPYARRRALPRAWTDTLETLSTSASARLRFILDAEGVRGARLAELSVRIGCSPAEAKDLVAGSETRAGPHNLFSSRIVEEVMATVRRIVAEYEIKSPLALGVPARTLRETLRVDEELADISIRELEQGGDIDVYGPLIRRTGWVPVPSISDLQSSDRLAHDICAGRQEPPSVGDLVSRYGSAVPALLRFLERQERIVQVEADRYYDRRVLDAMIARLRGGLMTGQAYTPAQLRDVLGLSRKYLIPFLEFCDRKGITERRGDGRILRETGGVLLDTSGAHS